MVMKKGDEGNHKQNKFSQVHGWSTDWSLRFHRLDPSPLSPFNGLKSSSKRSSERQVTTEIAQQSADLAYTEDGCGPISRHKRAEGVLSP